jgi:hypothetical protein
MGIFESALCFLVRDDTGAPSFSPAGMFDCAGQIIPLDWYFSLREGVHASGRRLWTTPCIALWGYNELITDLSHVDLLADRESQALQIFHREVMRRVVDESE